MGRGAGQQAGSVVTGCPAVSKNLAQQHVALVNSLLAFLRPKAALCSSGFL